MSELTFDIRIDANSNPGTVDIEIYEVVDTPGGRVTDTATTLAVTHVPDRGDIPGDGDTWYDTGEPAQMAQFAQLPEWLRDEALNTLALGYLAVMDRQRSPYDTH